MNVSRSRRLILVAMAVLIWTCFASSVRAGIMAGVLNVHDGEVTVLRPRSRGPQPVTGAARLGEGDVISVRRGTATVTFFDNGRASLDGGVSYRVGSFGLERLVGQSSLMVHQFREKLDRQALLKDHPLTPATVGTVVPVAETKVRRGGETAWQLVTTPQPLLVNDQVWTGPHGAARLVANDGSVCQLRDGTRVYVLAEGIELEAGGCLVNAPGKGFRLRTPSVVTLAQGALFEVAQGQGASVRAFRGKLAARNRPAGKGRAQGVRLAEGQTVEITASGAMSRPARFTSPDDARQLAAAIVGQMTAPAGSGAPAPVVAAAPRAIVAPRPAPAPRSVPRPEPEAAPVLQALGGPAPAAPVRLPRALPVPAPAPVQTAAASRVNLPSPADFFETATPYQEMIGFADSLEPPPVLVPSDEDLRTAQRLLATPVSPAMQVAQGESAPMGRAAPETAAAPAPVRATVPAAVPSMPSWRDERQVAMAGASPAPRRSEMVEASGERRWAQAPQDTAWPEGLPRPGVTVSGRNVATF